MANRENDWKRERDNARRNKAKSRETFSFAASMPETEFYQDRQRNYF